MTHRLRAPFALAALLAVGCGGDNAALAPDAGRPSDAAMPGPVAASMTVEVQPARTFYRTGQTVALSASVVDAEGEPLAMPDVRFSSSGAAVSEGDDDRYELRAEGRVRFEACTRGPEGAPLCGAATILVDDGSPALEVTSPVAGAELGGEGSELIEVSGSVSEPEGATVFVNGVPAPVDELGAFHAGVDPLPGVNHVEVVASDGVSDESRVTMDVLWAPAYANAVTGEGTPGITLDDGILLDLGQRLFDNGRPLDSTALPLETRDLADVLELVLLRSDLTSVLPDPLVDNAPTFYLRGTDVRVGEPAVSIELVEGGAELFARIGSLELDTEGQLDVDGSTLDLGGGVTAQVAAFAHITMDKADVGAPVEVSLDGLQVALESVQGRFASEEANALLRLAEGLLRSTLEQELEAAVSDLLAGTLPSVLGDALRSLDQSLRGRRIAVEAEAFPDVEVAFDGRIGRLEASRRSVGARLETAMGTDVPALHDATRGVARLSTVDRNPLFAGPAAQLAMRATLLNGLLHGLWNSGLLEVDATPLIPDSFQSLVDEATVEGKLPPVLRPARGDEAHDLMLELGQLELELVVLEDRTRYGVSVRAGVDLSVTDNAIGLEVAEQPELRTWIIESESQRPVVDEATLAELLRDELWTEIRGALAGGLSVELPAVEVDGLSEVAPDLTGFALSFETTAPVDVRDGYAVFDIALTGTLP